METGAGLLPAFSLNMKRSMCRVLVKHAKLNTAGVEQFLNASLVHMTDKESCKVLLNAGINPVLAMNYAIARKKKLICQWLLELGVDPFRGSTHTNEVHVPSQFQSSTHLADTSMLEFFLTRRNKRFVNDNGGRDDNRDYPIHLRYPKVSVPAIKLY
jgi:hypothetical protein